MKMKKPENLLQQNISFQALLQSVTDYVIAVNRDFQIIMANDVFKSRFDIHSGTLCYQALKGRNEKCENCLMEKCLADGQVHWREKVFITRDGKTSQVRVKATPVKNGSGKIAYILETATDLTQKRRMQKELNQTAGHLENLITERIQHLEKSEKRYRTIFERSRDGIILTDSSGKMIEVNQAGIEILGYASKKELISKGPASALFENKEDLFRLLKSISQKGFVTEFETRLLGKHNQLFDGLITSNVILDIVGQITGYVIIIRNISKRKKARQQIKIQNSRLAAINAISTTISSSLNLRDVLNHTTEKICEIVGSDCVRLYLLDKKKGILNLSSHKGLSSQFIKMNHVRARKVGDGLLGQTLQTGEVRLVDNLIPAEDPYVNYLIREGLKSTVYIPLVSQGEPVGVMCVCSHAAFKFSSDDVKFLTAIGNQIGLAVHNADLYENISRAYQELKEAQEQVIRTEKLASLGKLSATIAHEINNPIAALLTYIRLLMKLIDRQRFTPARIKDISRYLKTMESETTRCGEIVKNLLSFSRQSGIRIKPSDLTEIINETLPVIAHELELKEIKLLKSIETDLPLVQCDFRQIQQVLLNLMSNAIEATGKGDVLSVKAKHLAAGGLVEIVISDTGCGISKSHQRHIFEPFFTTKDDGKGVGLGLSVVYGIVVNHNGSITVESEPGLGTVFRIRLPIA